MLFTTNTNIIVIVQTTPAKMHGDAFSEIFHMSPLSRDGTEVLRKLMIHRRVPSPRNKKSIKEDAME